VQDVECAVWISSLGYNIYLCGSDRAFAVARLRYTFKLVGFELAG
jgi:hypothetical protein